MGYLPAANKLAVDMFNARAANLAAFHVTGGIDFLRSAGDTRDYLFTNSSPWGEDVDR